MECVLSTTDDSPFDVCAVAKRCLAGDQQAMLDLVKQFQGRVFGLCLRMLGQREDAEDCAQETFVRALRHLDKWDPSRRFEPWLLAIAANRCRTLIGKRMKAPRNETLPADSLTDDHHQRYAAEQLAEELQLALNQIRPEYRQAFVLFHNHELSYLEIAETLDAPVGTVKTWVHRARKEVIAQLTRRNVVWERSHAMRTV